MHYSPSTGGFYLAAIHGENIPSDAVEITDELHASLLDGQSSGRSIVPGPGGMPELAAYVAPPPPTPSPKTPLQFIERFTEAEQLAIVTASMQVPAVKLWYDKLLGASEVVQTDQRLIDGMAALVAAGLITAERSAEVLAWT